MTTFFTGTGTPIRIDGSAADLSITPWDDVLHRGWNSGVPDNTLPAFYLVWENGFSWGECDLRMSSDKQVILAHDNTISGKLNGVDTTLTVPDSTAQQLCSLVLQTHEKFGDIHPCTLAEVLDLAKTVNMGLVLDVKNGSNTFNNEEFHKILAATVVASGWAAHVVYMPTTLQGAKWIQEVDRNASFDFVASVYDSGKESFLSGLANYRELLTGANTVGFDLNTSAWGGEDVITAIHDAGLNVSFWNVSNTNFFQYSPLRVTYTGTGKANLGRDHIRQKRFDLATRYPSG